MCNTGLCESVEALAYINKFFSGGKDGCVTPAIGSYAFDPATAIDPERAFERGDAGAKVGDDSKPNSFFPGPYVGLLADKLSAEERKSLPLRGASEVYMEALEKCERAGAKLTIVSIGFLTNVAAVLDTAKCRGHDDGRLRELLRTRVERILVMGGGWFRKVRGTASIFRYDDSHDSSIFFA